MKKKKKKNREEEDKKIEEEHIYNNPKPKHEPNKEEDVSSEYEGYEVSDL